VAGEFTVTTEPLSLDVGPGVALHVAGSIDASTAAELEAAFEAARKDGGRFFVLDVSTVEYLASAGLRLLLKFRRAAINAEGCVAVAGLRRDIRENVFDSLGFSRLIDLYVDVDEAVRAFNHRDEF